MKRHRLGVSVVLLTIVLSAAMWGAVTYQRSSTTALTGTLIRTASTAIDRVDLDHLGPLPAPVEKYLRRALTDGQEPIVVARFVQAGELRTGLHSDRWYRFEASQTVAPPRRGFVWDARVDVAPFIHLDVRDAYLDGQGSAHVALLSAVTVGGDRGRAEMNSGSLHRYLAEAVWYPTALLPGNGLRWDSIDDRRALATLTDAGVTVSLEFRFDEDGDVAAIYAPGRWGQFDDGYRLAPWEGHFRSYRTMRGMRVPAEGEVGWYDQGTWQRVWTGHVIDTRYEFAPTTGS